MFSIESRVSLPFGVVVVGFPGVFGVNFGFGSKLCRLAPMCLSCRHSVFVLSSIHLARHIPLMSILSDCSLKVENVSTASTESKSLDRLIENVETAALFILIWLGVQ